MKIFDIHIFFGKSLYGNKVTKDFLVENGLHYAALTPAKPYDYSYISANQKICNWANNTNYHHILRVDPWHLEESLQLIREHNSRVLFLHPFEEQMYPHHKNFMALIEEAQAKSMYVMIACGHLPFSHSSKIFPVVQRFPKVQFILTHGGQINISGMHMEEAFEIFTNFENTIFETSGIYREDYIERAISKLGSDRIVFGSGTPYYHYDYELKRIEYLNTSDTNKEKILFHNTNRIFHE